MNKKIKSFHQELKKMWKTKKKSSVIVYFILRALVTLCMILEFLRGDLNNAMLCLLSLTLLILPFFFQKKLKIELPNTLEIIILLFIFSAEILGEMNNFYNIIPHWDTMLHTINGFLSAGFGFALIDLLNKNFDSINLSPLFISIVAFCFSMTIGVLWEFFEFTSDTYFLKSDMQKDNIVSRIDSVWLNPEGKNIAIKVDNIKYSIIYSEDKDGNIVETKIENGYLDIGLIDTIKDLFVNFIGALCFSIFGFLYLMNRDKYHFLSNFIPMKAKEE